MQIYLRQLRQPPAARREPASCGRSRSPARRARRNCRTCRPWTRAAIGDTRSRPIWNGMLAPAGTPAAIVDKLNAAVNDSARARPRSRPASRSSVPIRDRHPQEFAAFIAAEAERWGKVVREGREHQGRMSRAAPGGMTVRPPMRPEFQRSLNLMIERLSRGPRSNPLRKVRLGLGHEGRGHAACRAVFGAVLAALSVSSASAVVRITGDPGGQIGPYLENLMALREFRRARHHRRAVPLRLHDGARRHPARAHLRDARARGSASTPPGIPARTAGR